MSNATPFVSAVINLLETERGFPYIPDKDVRAATELIRDTRPDFPAEDVNPYYVHDELDRLIRKQQGYAV